MDPKKDINTYPKCINKSVSVSFDGDTLDKIEELSRKLIREIDGVKPSGRSKIVRLSVSYYYHHVFNK